MSNKKIIVTGVTGQDGSHMADYLIKNTQHEIYGGIRRLSVKNHDNILHLENEKRFNLINLDLNDPHSIRDVIIDIQPDYFINFAAQSFVAGSWDYPIQTWETDSNAILHILESIRRFSPHCRFYNAGSSEEFGDIDYSPQDEKHPLNPQSPYGAAKCAARHLVRVYRESYNLFAIQGWLFNHEGTRRGLDFVTRKISSSVAKIKLSIEKKQPIPILELGNLESQRDWTDAEDFMDGVWLMINNSKPKNYVLSSGTMHTVRDFLEETLKCAEIKYRIEGSKEKEKYYTLDGDLFFQINLKFHRPAEVHELCGDCSLAEKELGWRKKNTFQNLVKKMYNHDYELGSKS
jgi:GDPmannose 4,6-dehydratase